MRLWISLALACAVLACAWAQDEGDLVHTVGEGETLIGIASVYGVSLEQVLTLNNLDPEAYLQIGQRIVVIPADQLERATAEPEAEEPAAPDATPQVAVSLRGTAGLPPAPVIPAAAPVIDPADLRPLLCIAVYLDENQNALREPNETFLADGQIALFDSADLELLRLTTDAAAQPDCRPDVAPALYRIEGRPPAGYGLSSPASLVLDLRGGGRVSVEFGAKPGLQPFLPPASSPPATVADQPDAAGSLLREFSGVFALLLAGAVLMLGGLVSLFLRGR